MISFLVAPDDQHLGRLDPSVLPEQCLMEIFVEGFQNKTKFQDKNGHFTDCHDWNGTHVIDGVITPLAINDYKNPLEGSLNVRFLPSTVTLLRLVDQKQGGQLDTAEIPWNLISIELCENSLDGSFITEGLPQSILLVNIDGNNFCSTLDLTAHLFHPFLSPTSIHFRMLR